MNTQELNQLNEALRTAICKSNVQEAKALLAQGADPNYTLPREAYAGMSNYEAQPYSPLRLVVFVISDSFMTDQDRQAQKEIARLLIQNGADTRSALKLAEKRYGPIRPSVNPTSFERVLLEIQDAQRAS